MEKLKTVQPGHGIELTDLAYQAYINTDDEIYVDDNGLYAVGTNQSDFYFTENTEDQVNEFFEAFDVVEVEQSFSKQYFDSYENVKNYFGEDYSISEADQGVLIIDGEVLASDEDWQDWVDEHCG